MKRIVLVVVLALLAIVVVPRPASSAGPCADESRACVVATAQTYIDALLSHDASRVRLASDVVRYENGIESARGAADLRHVLATSPLLKLITHIRNERWIVDGGNAVVYYLIDTNAVPGVPQHAATAHVAEWFHVSHGLITRIDLVVCFAGALTPEGGQAASRDKDLTDLCIRSGPKGL